MTTPPTKTSVRLQGRLEPGFTLIEVALSIVVGIVIVAGGVVLYNQVRASAQNSLANDKALALTNLVEEMAAANNGIYPQLNSLQASWPTKRPNDYNNSPWGGTLTTGISGLDGNAGVLAAAVLGDGESGVATPSSYPADRGRLYYFMSPSNAYFWVDDFSVGDTVSSGTTRVKGYCVAYLHPNTGQRWYLVVGGGATRAPGTGPGGSLSGGVGP